MPDTWSLSLLSVQIPLVEPFRTSLGVEYTKDALVLRLETPFGVGWAECSADVTPTYGPEMIAGARMVIGEVLLPLVAAAHARSGEDARLAMRPIPRNENARAALEAAVLDAEGQRDRRSLAAMLGGTRESVEVGVSLGIPADLPALLASVDRWVGEGYKRIKLKVRPGWDVGPVAAVREKYGADLLLSVDANQAYEWENAADVATLHELDRYGLLMIEQPFRFDEIVDHARLGQVLETRICLDESIRSLADAEAALELEACRIINIKPARVGGYLTGVAIHDLAVSRDIPVWCGGMLESGVGRAANTALASLPGFTLPADLSATKRYFTRDITPSVAPVDGMLAVPTGPGIGAIVDEDAVRDFTVTSSVFEAVER